MQYRSRRRLRELFRTALRLDPAARRRFLEQECADDAALADQLRSMLQGLDPHREIAPIGVLDTAAREMPIDRVLPYTAIGPYELVRVIARGAMGTVYEGRDKQGRRVAVKCVHGGASAAGPDVLRRFELESQTLAHLNHPHIASVLGSGRTPDGAPYLAMEFVPGEPLDEYVRFRELSLRNRLQIFLQLCDAVFHAHVNGVIHRDLKPSNVFVTEDSSSTAARASTRSSPVVKVLDFGLARVTNPEIRLEAAWSESRAFLGTIQYMSPEQAAGDSRNTDARSDVYSLGVLLYELLTDHQPYSLDGALLPEVLRVICETPPRRPSQWNAALRGDLERILLTALEKAPARRYQSAAAMAEDVERHLLGLPILTRSASSPGYLWRVASRHRALTTALAYATLILMAAAAWFLVQLQDERNRARTAARSALASEHDARERADEAERARIQAQQERDRVQQLEDARRAALLVRRADELWPAVPALAEEMREWIADADMLLARHAQHRDALLALARLGTALPHADDAVLAFHRDRRTGLQDMLEDAADAALRQTLQADLDASSELILAMEQRLTRERGYRFDDRDEQFRFDTLAALVGDLEDLAAQHAHRPTLHAMRARLLRAERLRRETIDEHRDAWRMTIDEIRDPLRSAAYQGLEILPQLGLVPLGRDPASGLHEFWHVQSGARPERAQDGALRVTEESGIVLVLVPGGTLRPGSDSAADDAPAASASVEPFLLSRHELTQGQWLRATGANPSFQRPGSDVRGRQTTLLHPVERVSWTDADRALRRLALMLPSEIQWEYACRAGSDTTFGYGPGPEHLDGAARLAGTATAAGGILGHLPVGSLRPNAFGLHDMHGNVAEWCFDRYSERVRRQVNREAEDDLVALETSFADADPRRVFRGGGFLDRAEDATSAARRAASPDARHDALGLRAARRLEQ